MNTITRNSNDDECRLSAVRPAQAPPATMSDSQANAANPLQRERSSLVAQLRRRGAISSSDTNDGNRAAQAPIWTRSLWDIIATRRTSSQGRAYRCWDCKQGARWGCRQIPQIIKRHPLILLWTAMTFAALCSIGTVFAFQFADNHEQAHRDDARQLAIKTGKFFSSKLDQAVLPLFSMAQFVYEIDVFRDLPGLVGDLGAPGALPLLPTPVPGGAAYRNVTGVCDDPELVSRFNAIAASMKHHAGVEGILVNLQLSPVAVVCLAYPLNNTKDFPPGIFLDNTGIIGYDILRDPARRFTAEETLQGDKIVTSGPLILMQCKDCDPTVEKAFIARLPIAMDRYNITVHGEPLRRWGFATALINWEALVDRSMIREEFREKNLHFRLIRPEKKLNTATGDYYVEDILLAESDGFVSDNGQAESVELNTTDNVWRITIGSVDGFRPMNMPLIIWAVVAASIVISFMLLLVLVENHAYGDLLKEILPPCALRKIQNGETVVEQYDMISVFFSDIIGYTTMVAEMSPISVMEMLNEYYSKMDRLAEKHRVYKVETIGDAYMVTAGCPDRCTATEAAENVAVFALDAVAAIKDFRAPDGSQLFVRVGIHSGPAVAGVVGTKRPQYTLFGDTVIAAARMESTSMKMKVQCSESTYRLLLDAPNYDFDLKPRQRDDMTGDEPLDTWWIEGLKMNSNAIESS